MSKNMDGKIKGRVWKNLLQTAVALVALVVVWVAAHALVGNELLIPDFSACLKEVGKMLGKAAFWTAFWNTFRRVLIAFALSFAFAAFFAVIAYLVPWFCRILSPLVSFLRSLPTLAVLLIILVWSGAAVAPVVVAFLSLFPMLYAGILAALNEVDGALVDMSRVYRVPLRKQIFDLYLPSAAPYVLRESGAALAFSLKLVVSAEVLANTYRSLGGLMQEAKLYYEMPTLFALVLLAFSLGLILETLGALAAELVERRVK